VDAAGAPAAPLPDSYEAARDELTAVVERLEAGGLTLDESLTLWERGQGLATACETFLAGARKRVEAALAADGGNAADGESAADSGNVADG
jgi:exodeoxyribonuclease VII small subunit